MEARRTASEAWLDISVEEQDLILKGLLATIAQWSMKEGARIIIDSLAECAQERGQEASSPRPIVKRWVSLDG